MSSTTLLVAVASLATTASIASASIATAEFLPAEDAYDASGAVGLTTNSSNFNIHWGQGFTSSVGGFLENLTVRAYRVADAVENLQLELYTVDGFGAIDQLVAAGEVDKSSGPADQQALRTANFDGQGIQIFPNTAYALIIGQENGWSRNAGETQSWDVPSVFGGDAYEGDMYQSINGGGSFLMPNSRDFGFQVTIVPAPGALAMLGFSGLASMRRRR